MSEIALIGKKIGMTREFYKTGQLVPVTVLKMEKARVIQVIEEDKRGYKAVQLGYGKIKNSKLTKAMKGYFAKKNTEAKKLLKEFRVENTETYKEGNEFGLEIFKDIKFTEKKVYDSYEHPDWVIKEDYYAEFGCFVDYLIRRMIANENKNWNDSYSGFYDKRANEVITSCFLKSNLFYKWCKYNKGIIACLKLYEHKSKINRKRFNENC